VYFNAGDEITETAQLGAEIGITDPVWGEMGHAGYRGDDPFITNINCGDDRGTGFAFSGMPAAHTVV
jgi:hypothetical protein